MTNPTRREFLTASAIAAGGISLARADEAKEQPSSSPNEKITLGIIGVGGMGRGLLNIFKKMPDVNIAAVCDVYEPNRLKAKELAGGKADDYKDFRKILDRKDIDAVVVATPDHWHAIPTILACQAEKDVYCEKPLAFRIGEGRRMADAAAKYGRVTQMGNLIHAEENYHRVVEIVQSGILGKIARTQVAMAADRSGLGHPADSEPPAGLDWDFWLGSAPKRAFNKNRFLFNWRYFWDYGGGMLADFCCHIMDPIIWAMGVTSPETITASGGRYALDDNAETPDCMEVTYEFKTPDGQPFLLVWSHTDFNSRPLIAKGRRIMFQGTRGSLTSDYRAHEVTFEPGAEADLPEPTLPRSPGHHREWLDAIRTRGETSCNFEYGHRLTSLGHLGNIALWTGEKLKWDGEAERFTNSEKANEYLFRDEYRAPWTLPEI